MTEIEGMGEIISLDSRRVPEHYEDLESDEEVESYSGDASDYSFEDLPDGQHCEASALFWTGVEIPESIVARFTKMQQAQWKHDHRVERRSSLKKKNSYHMVPDAYGTLFFRILGLMRDALLSDDPQVSEEILGLTIQLDDYAINVRDAAKAYHLDWMVSEFFDASGRLLKRSSGDTH
ncbi:hypothetical protein [Ferrimicrobium acidiphilum]|jgi:hypothetical protein|uniref:hypothetical protein n=1 Tax=Ferrimicrobium acidiphilum TaxID=121039 RepID=UPI0023F57FB1|nr:hypothetical protein [Ferrimicrobium acidiphilum]